MNRKGILQVYPGIILQIGLIPRYWTEALNPGQLMDAFYLRVEEAALHKH